jgi:hypothetical protein
VMEFIMGHVSKISIEKLAELKLRFPKIWIKNGDISIGA